MHNHQILLHHVVSDGDCCHRIEIHIIGIITESAINNAIQYNGLFKNGMFTIDVTNHSENGIF